MNSSDCFAMNLRLINRMLTNIYDEHLRPINLTINQLNILMVIVEKEQISATELSEITMLTRSTLSRNLERMKKDGLIFTDPANSNKRQPLHLTEMGEKKLKEAATLWNKAQVKAYEILGPNGVELIKNLNDKDEE